MMKSLSKLKALLPPGEVTFDPAVLPEFAGDKWFATRQPDAVALPRSTESVCKILQFANRHNIPVTPRGGGYGYVGGCVPVRGGIVLALERLNRIVEIRAEGFVAVVQAGVNTQKLQDRVEKLGLFYPPDPASKANTLIGGNSATNAGGPRCLKYGVTRDYVLGLEVVLADGAVLRLGGRTHKNKTGFDLHRLFVGSEGLLGVVTEATLKLLPLPPCRSGDRGFLHARCGIPADQEQVVAGLPGLSDYRTRRTAWFGAKRYARTTPCPGVSKTGWYRNRVRGQAMRGDLGHSARILVCLARYRSDKTESGHRCAPRPRRGVVCFRRQASKETPACGSMLRPCRRWQHSHEHHGGFQSAGRAAAV